MVAIAVLAVILGFGVGLKRRVQRLDGLALRYGREANTLENLLEGSNLSQEDAVAKLPRRQPFISVDERCVTNVGCPLALPTSRRVL
jgi:hypothetical protein